jgi:hypothetical protein
MALPLIAAGIAARAVAKKLATRAAGGITGAGAKQVAPVYREMGAGSVKVVPSSTKTRREVVNEMSTSIAKKRKSGEQAKSIKDSIEPIYNTYKKSPTVKVNSNPTRSR